MTVEPPSHEGFSPTQESVTPRTRSHLVQDLAWLLDSTPDEAREWIEQYSAVQSEEKIRSYWIDE